MKPLALLCISAVGGLVVCLWISLGIPVSWSGRGCRSESSAASAAYAPTSSAESNGETLSFAQVLRRLREVPRAAPRGALESVFDATAKADFARLAAALAQQSQSERGAQLDALVRAWARREPRAALAWVQARPNADENGTLLVAGISAWAERDPQAALRFAQTLAASPVHANAIRDVIAEVAQRDPQAALDYVRALPVSPERHALLQAIASSLAVSDPALAAAFAETLPPGLSQTSAFTAVASGYAQRDLGAAVQWAQALPDGVAKTAALEQVVAVMALSDPRGAAELVLNSPARDRYTDAVAGIAEQWAQKDVGEALTWAGELPEGPARRQALFSIGLNLARTEPSLAFELALALHGDAQQNLLTEIAQGWTAGNAEAALAQARQMPAGSARDAFVSGLVETLARTSPVDAARCLAAFPLNASQAGPVDSIVSRWVAREPDGAATWVASFPRGEMRDTAVAQLASAWAAADPSAAGRWLTELPAEVGRDAALRALTQQIASRSPAEAAPWTASIADPDLRSMAITTVARQWLVVDRSAAIAWLETTTLSRDQQRVLLHPGTGE